jgi:hypothetical protein
VDWFGWWGGGYDPDLFSICLDWDGYCAGAEPFNTCETIEIHASGEEGAVRGAKCMRMCMYVMSLFNNVFLAILPASWCYYIYLTHIHTSHTSRVGPIYINGGAHTRPSAGLLGVLVAAVASMWAAQWL